MAKDLPVQTFKSEDGTTWIEIATAPSSDEAQLMQGFLEAEGIDAVIEHAEARQFPSTMGKLGDVRVFVPSEDEPRALELLRQREREFRESPLSVVAETLIQLFGEILMKRFGDIPLPRKKWGWQQGR